MLVVVLVQVPVAAPEALAQAPALAAPARAPGPAARAQAPGLLAQAQAPARVLDQVALGPVPARPVVGSPNLGSSHSWQPAPVGQGPWRRHSLRSCRPRNATPHCRFLSKQLMVIIMKRVSQLEPINRKVSPPTSHPT